MFIFTASKQPQGQGWAQVRHTWRMWSQGVGAGMWMWMPASKSLPDAWAYATDTTGNKRHTWAAKWQPEWQPGLHQQSRAHASLHACHMKYIQ
eukprot:261117-Pelagomonas_calceolata.AAC.2